jgi:hypothetical protein
MPCDRGHWSVRHSDKDTNGRRVAQKTGGIPVPS